MAQRLQGAGPATSWPIEEHSSAAVGCTGIGLHTGRPVRLDLKPAPAGTASASAAPTSGSRSPPTFDHLDRLDHATTLSRDGVSDRHRRAPALGPLRPGRGRRAGRGGRSRDPGARRQRGALRHPDPRGGPAAHCKVARRVPEDPEAGRGGARRQVGAPVARRPLPSQLHDRLRPPAAAPPDARRCASAAETFAEEIAPARTFGFLREVETLRQRGPRPRGQPRERDRDRRDRRPQQQAALRGRVRAPQDPRRDRRPGAPRAPDGRPPRGQQGRPRAARRARAKLLETPDAWALVDAAAAARGDAALDAAPAPLAPARLDASRPRP